MNEKNDQALNKYMSLKVRTFLFLEDPLQVDSILGILHAVLLRPDEFEVPGIRVEL